MHDLLWKVIRANQAADPVHAPNETLEVVKSLAGGPSVEWKALPDGDNWAFENAGQVSFDYRSYNGTYYFGFGDSLFLTQWTESGDGSIWAYGEADDSIESVAVVQSFLEKGSARQEDVGALSHVRLDFTSTRQRAEEGDLLLFRKATNLVLTVLVDKVVAKGVPGIPVGLTCSYRIVQWENLPAADRARRDDVEALGDG